MWKKVKTLVLSGALTAAARLHQEANEVRWGVTVPCVAKRQVWCARAPLQKRRVAEQAIAAGIVKADATEDAPLTVQGDLSLYTDVSGRSYPACGSAAWCEPPLVAMHCIDAACC